MRLARSLWLVLSFAACGDSSPPAAASAQGPQAPAALEHDYGVIPHGEARSHDFVLDLASLGPDWIPLHVQLDCSCGRAQMLAIGPDGTERPIDGRPVLENAPRDGERAVARVVVDTALREAVDLAPTASHGYVVLQSARDTRATSRVRWPLLLRFGIDAPVALRPFAALDFGRVPTCRTAELVTELTGDENHRSVRFLRAGSTVAALEPTLEPAEDGAVLRVRCRPGELGNHRAVVAVETDLPSGYTVQIPVTWKVVPDVEAVPMAKISFRADLRREQTEAEAAGQFVVVTDHDDTRPAEFVVQDVVDGAGRDASGTFSFRFEPVPGQPRQHRFFVRYLGGAPDGFRGHVLLGKPGAATAVLSIDLVAFPTS